MIVDNENTKKRKRALNIHYLNYVNVFEKWLIRLGYVKSTVVSYTHKLKFFFLELQDLQIYTIYHIKNEHVQGYYQKLLQRDISTSHLRCYILAIKNFNRYLQKTEYYTIPFKAIVIGKQQANIPDILSQEEVHILFKSLGESPSAMRDNAMLHLLYSCGLRCEEVTRVRIKDIDYHRQLLYVQPGKTKLGRYVPMHPKVSADLRAYQTYARPLINSYGKHFLVGSKSVIFSTKSIRRSLIQILEHTTIHKNITPHGLRHSIATHLLQQGLSIDQIAQFLGHKSIESTQIYVRMNQQLLYGK